MTNGLVTGEDLVLEHNPYYNNISASTKAGFILNR